MVRAYSLWDPSVGYYQGMAFVAGLFLLQLETEEAAFWVLVAFVHDLRGTEYYAPPPAAMQGLQAETAALSALVRDRWPALASSMDVAAADVAPDGTTMGNCATRGDALHVFCQMLGPKLLVPATV